MENQLFLIPQKTLVMNNSTKVLNRRIHWISYILPISKMLIGIIGFIPAIFMAGLLRIVGFLLIILFFKGLLSLLNNIFTKIGVSDSYLSVRTGIIEKKSIDIPLNKIEGSILTQSIFGKLLNFGKLTVTTGGVTTIFLVKNPNEFLNSLVQPNNRF